MSVAIEEQSKEICFKLLQNIPNPFFRETIIKYCIGNTVDRVQLKIYDASGRLVKTLVDNTSIKPDNYNLKWEGIDNSGNKVSAGVYFYKLEAGKFKSIKKLILLK